ncbi:MAG: hypothetical protein RLY89_2755, partial [Bacteroidota bacterium]
VLMGWADETYKHVIEESLDQFRQLFRVWVTTFEKDSFDDEWGLFL